MPTNPEATEDLVTQTWEITPQGVYWLIGVEIFAFLVMGLMFLREIGDVVTLINRIADHEANGDEETKRTPK